MTTTTLPLSLVQPPAGFDQGAFLVQLDGFAVWASVAYERGRGYSVGFSDPILTDSATFADAYGNISLGEAWALAARSTERNIVEDARADGRDY